MANSHRNGDSRSCGATTIASGQLFVKINGQAWAVEGDKDSHGDGALIATQSYVKINGTKVILVGDNAYPDDAHHINPSAASGDATVKVN